jgi:hypothetical protein
MGDTSIVLQPGFAANRGADSGDRNDVWAIEISAGLAATVAADNVARNLQTVLTGLRARPVSPAAP